MVHLVVNDPSTMPEVAFAKITPAQAKSALADVTTLAIDLKTTGLDPSEDEIKAVTIATRKEEIYILTTEVINSSLLIDLLSGAYIIVNSGLKDISFLMAMGVDISSVFDTCLCDQLCNANVDQMKISYELPAILKRYGITNSFTFYESINFWKDGFSMGGCNYLTLYVRHLFELRDKIYEEHPQSSNLFLMMNRMLLMASQMNITPLKLDRQKIHDASNNLLEEICASEANFLEVFQALGKYPESLKQELSLPDYNEKITPLFDIDDPDEIAKYIDSIDYDSAADAAYESGLIDSLPSLQMFDDYADQVRMYNDVYRKLVAQKSDDLYSHFIPMSTKSLGIQGVTGFPCPTKARNQKINPFLATTINPYHLFGEDVFNYDDGELRLVEIEDVEIFGLGVLTNDVHTIRFASNRSVEVGYLIDELEAKGIKFHSVKGVEALVGNILRGGCKLSDHDMIRSSIEKDSVPEFLKIFSQRYYHTVETVSGLIKRIQHYGNAMIFSEYELNWENFQWTNMIGKKLTTEFWQTYEPHRQAKDEVYQEVTQYYKEHGLVQSVVRKLVMNYARMFVMSHTMFAYFDAIREENLGQTIRLAAGDHNSFVLEYPPIMASALDDIEATVKASLVRRFGENIPITSTII